MKFPAPLTRNSTIAITAFSAGVDKTFHPRLDLVINDLKSNGFNIIEGQCLRQSAKYVSAPVQERLSELMQFLLDDSVDAIAPPWGGEIAMELLPLLNWKELESAKPKWIFGFSDISTLTAAFTAKLGWATVHCSNLIQLSNAQNDDLTKNTLNHLMTPSGASFIQHQSDYFATQWADHRNKPDSVQIFDNQTQWKWFSAPASKPLTGRLLGGCFDTLYHLFETEYLDTSAMNRKYDEGILLYLENAEMNPSDVVRALLNMKFRGVFNNINGLLLGRDAAVPVTNKNQLSYIEALHLALDDLMLESLAVDDMHIQDSNNQQSRLPIIYDMDIGHQPPNLTLINGAVASVELPKNGKGSITQKLI